MKLLHPKTISAKALAILFGFSNVQAFPFNGDDRSRRSLATNEPLVATQNSYIAQHLLTKDDTLLDAETSASIYMNPVTEKLGQVTISWETDTATKIRNKQLEKRLEHTGEKQEPFMVGVVGIPGSGKSTSAEILSAFLKDSIVMPMDGYHIPKAELEKAPNAEDLLYRRGAPDTFDPISAEHDLQRIVHGDEPQVSIPGFDHAKGDPEKDLHTFDRKEHSIVICEGIYLMHEDDGWENIKNLFDYTIYIDVGVDTCIQRLKARNKCIAGYSPEEIEIRCEVVDRANAEMVEKSRIFASEEVKSGTA
eukprot:scaffold747_cov120-Cylindrotheca_fusiformis.AAC.20